MKARPKTALTVLTIALVTPLLLAPSMSRADEAAAVGTVLPSADIAPGIPGASLLPRGTLEAAVTAYRADDLDTARRELDELIEVRRIGGEDRPRAQFLRGWIAMRRGNHQQASADFYRLRKLEDHPLSEMASYLEAENDRLRGHARTAIEECDAYLKAYEEGRFVDDCRLTRAHADADLGRLGEAAKQFSAFLEKNPDDQRAEAVALRLASAYEVLGRVEEAGARYRALFLDHQLPSTGREAEDALRRLEASGVATPPLQDMELYTRACSLRRTGQYDASYDLFCELDQRNPSDGEGATPLGKRLEQERHQFLWRNRKYLEVGRWNASAYDKNPNAKDAAERVYWAVQGYSRSGYFQEAVKYQELGVKRFGRSYRFRGKEERSALLYLAAGKYPDARAAYQAWQKRSGRAKRSAKVNFFIAYAAYRAGDLDTAVEELTPMTGKRSKYRTAAYWYRSKAYDKLGKRKEAAADRKKVVERNPDGWYALLVRDRERRAEGTRDGLVHRDGRWPGEAPRAVPPPPTPPPPVSEAVVRLLDGLNKEPGGPVRPIRSRDDDALLRDADGRVVQRPPASMWPIGVVATEPIEPESSAVDDEHETGAGSKPTDSGDASRLALDPFTVPTTWRPSPYWDETTGTALWEAFATTNKHLWEDLPRAYELSRIGLGEEAGSVLAEVFAEAKKVRRSRSIKRRVARWRVQEAKRLAAEAAEREAVARPVAAPANPESDAAPPDAEGGEPPGSVEEQRPSLPPPSKEARWAAILDLKVKNKDWMAIFAAAGSPPGVSDFAVNSIPYAKLPRSGGPEVAAAWTMTYPAAYGPHVWKHSRANNVDPLLMLSIMRAESLFRHDAVSHAGALGLVQVMPATGSRVAALAGMNDFRVERLLDPAVNIALGTFYLGRLLERFHGQYHLAVGSYNGGPHNVGRWLRGKVGIPYDEFVEEIAFDETRGYIKKVTRFYAIYLDLYANGALPDMPLTTSADDAGVIDF